MRSTPLRQLLALGGNGAVERTADPTLTDVAKIAGNPAQPHGAAIAADGLRHRCALGQQLLDQLFDGYAIALLEGRAKRLAVVGKDDEGIGFGRLLVDHVFQAGKRLVQPLQVAKGITRPWP